MLTLDPHARGAHIAMVSIVGLLAACILALLHPPRYALAEESPPSPEKPPPPFKKWTPGTQKNIIFLLTDDQDLRLGSMGAMPFTMEHIMHAGANVSNFFIHTPICCPSRTTLMSGKFVHNNKVRDANSGGCMRMNTSRASGGNPSFWEDSFIHRLRYEQGYTTGVFVSSLPQHLGACCLPCAAVEGWWVGRTQGKLLNVMKTYGCDGSFDVPGLDRGYIMCNPSFFNENWADYTVDASGHGSGSVYQTGSEPENYTTSLVGNHSLAWIRSVVESGKDHPPFFGDTTSPRLPLTWMEGGGGRI
jgi:N-acetylglucosamine-6-sulfatase